MGSDNKKTINNAQATRRQCQLVLGSETSMIGRDKAKANKKKKIIGVVFEGSRAFGLK